MKESKKERKKFGVFVNIKILFFGIVSLFSLLDLGKLTHGERGRCAVAVLRKPDRQLQDQRIWFFKSKAIFAGATARRTFSTARAQSQSPHGIVLKREKKRRKST